MSPIISVLLWRRMRPLGLVLLMATGPVQAQVQQGTLQILHWPASEEELRQVMGEEGGPWLRVEVLPFLDSLVLGYRYEVVGDTVHATFTLAWYPATWGLYRGRRVLWDQMPGEVQLQAMHVRIRFAVQGRPVAAWPLRFDSLALGPWPEVFASDTYSFPAQEVFGWVPSDSLAAWLAAGMAPDSLMLEWIAFTGQEAGGVQAQSMVRVYPEPPFIEVILDSEMVMRQGASKRATVEGRPRQTGRSAERSRVRREGGGRSSGRGWFRGKADDAEEEEEEHETLLPAALVGVAVVAMVAVAGGGLGYAGNLKRTPIGVTGGVLRTGWGMLWQVSMNKAVLDRSRTRPEELAVRLLGFAGWLAPRVQPALAVGMRWQEHRGNRRAFPVVVAGLVWRADPVVLMGGTDLVGGGLEVSVVLNLRQLLRY
ncbi:hypothetical protein [Rhodothermus profundi]|uniref:Uncharacterized protein n=1 Tax=Rhodothermus profundi TaxID=633813 RepID=A0A1M6THW1_9BACT|nr:hypothetical protein [Rhodothermus profundi]SHK56530.1 hypothetical protein SAMN04488087_1402 [Rhodothermus profundi]